MPVTLELVDDFATKEHFEKVFSFLVDVDNRFSTYKKDSEITNINEGKLKVEDCSDIAKEIFILAEETKKLTDGYFDIYNYGKIDPSGIVKGWTIYKASQILKNEGLKNFYVEIAGDIEFVGMNEEGQKWITGIRNPFDQNTIVKKLYLSDVGIATSGTYIQANHIYNPIGKNDMDEIVSLTVIGPNIYEADRFATGAFAMGRKGIEFIDKLDGFEGYMIDKDGMATMTSNFEKYTK